MSHPTSTCPQCGAKIEFRWSGAVQAVCEFCRSVLVRTDVDLRKVGTTADVTEDSSPIQLNVEGKFDNKAFTVVGRIQYQYAQGGWNEWHLLFNDGTSGWLSDAQLEWAVSVQRPPASLPASAIRVGQCYQFEGRMYEVTSVTTAHYRGVEGQLPFQYWDKSEVVFVDLRTPTRLFATLDFSDQPPTLYLGRFVEFAELQLTGLRQFEGWN